MPRNNEKALIFANQQLGLTLTAPASWCNSLLRACFFSVYVLLIILASYIFAVVLPLSCLFLQSWLQIKKKWYRFTQYMESTYSLVSSLGAYRYMHMHSCFFALMIDSWVMLGSVTWIFATSRSLEPCILL